MVEGDPTRLEQVFVNLLTNAAKYTETRGQIPVSAEADEGQSTIHPVPVSPHLYQELGLIQLQRVPRRVS